MNSLVEHLKRFNRKERYWVVQAALGSQACSQLDASFRDQLSKQLGEPVPADAWWAMDYHLDWLAAALVQRWGQALPDHVRAHLNPDMEAHGCLITGTHEDIDLMVAFGDTVVLIEAKGATSWSNVQLGKKLRRLAAIRACLGDAVMQHLRLVLLSPDEPQKLRYVDANDKPLPWPSFMQRRDGSGTPMWIQLEMGQTKPREFPLVTRCNERGVSDANGQYWCVLDGRATGPAQTRLPPSVRADA